MTQVIDLNLMNVELGKWPRLIVVGKPVTTEQAMEILIRTDDLQFTSNDAEFSSECGSYLYEVEPITLHGHWCLMNAFRDEKGDCDLDKYRERRDKVLNELQVLDLQYMYNERIVCSWLYGMKGWCDWDGHIGCSNYNIGSWPTVPEVYKEWRAIAQAFPYLDLKCQLVLDEGDGKIAVEFLVKDGGVIMHNPGPLLQAVVEMDISDMVLLTKNPHGERGCTYAYFKTAVEYLRSSNNLTKHLDRALQAAGHTTQIVEGEGATHILVGTIWEVVIDNTSDAPLYDTKAPTYDMWYHYPCSAHSSDKVQIGKVDTIKLVLAIVSSAATFT